MKTETSGADPTPQAEKNLPNPVNRLGCEEQKSLPTALPSLSEKDRVDFYDRLRTNIPEPLQKEKRWVLLYDTGEKKKMPINGHPSANKNLEEIISEHRAAGNNAPAIGYSTGGKSKTTGRILPPDPVCIWFDYDDLKDADGKTIAAPEIVEEIEKLREFGAYVEISMSGKGMHVCMPKPAYFDLHCKGVSHKCNQPEVFGNGQYVAVTGRIYRDKLPDWASFSANPHASALVRNIITRAQAWKAGVPPNLFGSMDDADVYVVEALQKLESNPPATKIAELIAETDIFCEFQYLTADTIRRFCPDATDDDITAAYDAGVVWQVHRSEERDESRRLMDEFHVQGGTTIPKIDFDAPESDWCGKITAINYINNYCRQNIPLKDITNPSKTAYRICATIMEYLQKHDPDHCTPPSINAVFMSCKLFPHLYGIDGMHRKKYPEKEDTGWDSRRAGMCIAAVWEKHEEQKRVMQRRIVEQIQADAADKAAVTKALEFIHAQPQHIHPTLGDCARYIASISSKFIGTRAVTDDPDGTTTPKYETYFFKRVLREYWHQVTHLVAIAESKTGHAWYDGIAWNIDPNGVGLKGAINQAAELIAENTCDAWSSATSTPAKPVSRTAAAEQIRKMCDCASDTLSTIAALRYEASVSTATVYGKGLTCTDGVVIIDEAGIHITQHDPDRDVWFGSVPVATTDLLPNLTDIHTLEEVVNHFQTAKEAIEACGEDKINLFASIAGSAIYYTMPNHIPLDAWYYLWDAVEGGTGKSTHMRRVRGFFGKYIAFGVGWEVFTGKNDQNGEFFGKIGVECEEADVNDIKSVEKLKARTSGGWELKMLYQNPVGVDQPLLMISLGNVKPLLSRVANTRPIWERLQPCEFTEKLRNTGAVYPRLSIRA